MVWKKDGPLGNESGKIKWEIVKWTRGRGLDLGCGLHKTFPHFIGVDNRKDAVLFGQPINPDIVVESAAELPMFATGSMDFVFSSHLLEHFPETAYDPRRFATVIERQLAEKMLTEKHTAVQALREWFRVIKRDGYLVLYVPDEDEYPKVGEEGANPDHALNLSYEKVVDLAKRTGAHWDLIDFQKRNQEHEYSLYFVFKKLGNGQRISCLQRQKPTKTCGVVRYGAYGDLMQVSSVLAGLKKQGYHVTFYTSPPGNEVIEHDPSVDAFYLQDKDQVPNHLLGDFWRYHAAKYDKWVNLSESVEGSLLTMPGRAVHAWSPEARHRVMNFNYLEIQHQIAGVAHEPKVKFYATADEERWADSQKKRLGPGPVIVWSLAGSSVHKTWSGLDATIASILLDFPEARVVLVGGPDARLLEQGWENESRVVKRSGEWKIRETLAFVQVADLVIGPETGVLNAVSHEPMPKVIMLSHSTHENLTRDWVNTRAVTSVNTTCPGRGANAAPACHQMHFGWEFCKQADDGTAQCQKDLDGAAIYALIRGALLEWKTPFSALRSA